MTRAGKEELCSQALECAKTTLTTSKATTGTSKWVQQISEHRSPAFYRLVMRNWEFDIWSAIYDHIEKHKHFSLLKKLKHQQKVWETQAHPDPLDCMADSLLLGCQFSKNCWICSVPSQSRNWPKDSKIWVEIQKVCNNSMSSANNMERLRLLLRLNRQSWWTKEVEPVWWRTSGQMEH